MVAGAPRIRVSFEVDADGLLHVTAREQTSGVEAAVSVKPSYGLGDEEIARMRAEAVLGALLLYRGLYYVLPLVLATGLLAAYELRSGVAAPVGRVAVHLSPRLMAALALVAGLWLLVSGVTPASDEAAQLLAMKVPLPLVEASHFIGSVAGFAMTIVLGMRLSGTETQSRRRLARLVRHRGHISVMVVLSLASAA